MTDHEGVWGRVLLLIAKPYQEDCAYISAFVWRLCVSYRFLNIITRSFEYRVFYHFVIFFNIDDDNTF